MAIRYKIVGRNMRFSNAGSFGSKKLAEKKMRMIRKIRKDAGVPYKSIRVVRFEIKI